MNKLQMIRKGGGALLLVFFLSCASTSRRDHVSILVDSLYKKNANLPCDIIIGYVLPDSSADRAGFERGDRVLRVNGKPVNTYKDFLIALRRLPDKTESVFTILRNRRETEMIFIPGEGRSRFGFRFKIRDPEITKNIKFDIWPSEVDPNIKTFNIFFYVAALINENSRSPKRRILQRIKEILINKGYYFTESYEDADFLVETKYKDTMNRIDPTTAPVKIIVPFEAFRVLFLDKKNNKPFLKVSGTIDQEKARIYGAKGYVFSMLDAMIEKFPDYPYRKKTSENFATSEKKLIDDKPPASENRFPGAGPF